MKLIDIYNAKEGLKVLDNMLLPVKDSIAVMTIIDTLNPHIERFKKQSDKLLIEFGTTKDNINYTIEQKSFEEYIKAKKQLENIEVDLKIESIHLNSNVSIKPYDLKMLQKIINIEVI